MTKDSLDNKGEWRRAAEKEAALFLVYLAGVFDGEGSIGLYARGARYRLQVSVTQNASASSEKLFSELGLLYGGCLVCSTRVRGGVKRPSFCWKLEGVEAAFFLKDLYPHLRLKKLECSVALDWWNNYVAGKLNDEYNAWKSNTLKELKRSWHK